MNLPGGGLPGGGAGPQRIPPRRPMGAGAAVGGKLQDVLAAMVGKMHMPSSPAVGAGVHMGPSPALGAGVHVAPPHVGGMHLPTPPVAHAGGVQLPPGQEPIGIPPFPQPAEPTLVPPPPEAAPVAHGAPMQIASLDPNLLIAILRGLTGGNARRPGRQL